MGAAVLFPVGIPVMLAAGSRRSLPVADMLSICAWHILHAHAPYAHMVPHSQRLGCSIVCACTLLQNMFCVQRKAANSFMQAASRHAYTHPEMNAAA